MRMSIKEINDQFYKEIIEHYKSIGDTENANKNEEFYNWLRAERVNMDIDNKRIVNELTK
ncbi:hypothetical protein [Bacillus subtilis]|uniref:hypothetical protein n=1 Tax=Bacillus subtilis TaxID=1423 RepID=UPI00100A1CF5|nr:hypothetical protein [Bacillus subtilis]QAW06664.1 hypothetical protein ES968_22135 [Bacillus subtilis]